MVLLCLYRLKCFDGKLMPNKKKKPDYDPNAVMQELLDSVTFAYSDSVSPTTHPSLREITDEFELNPIKVRKLLITADVYQSDLADDMLRLYREKKTVAEIMVLTGLSKHRSIRIFHTRKSHISWMRSV